MNFHNARSALINNRIQFVPSMRSVRTLPVDAGRIRISVVSRMHAALPIMSLPFRARCGLFLYTNNSTDASDAVPQVIHRIRWLHAEHKSTAYTFVLFLRVPCLRRVNGAASVCGFSACVFTFVSYQQSVDVERYRASVDGTFCLVGIVRPLCRNGSTSFISNLMYSTQSIYVKF